MTSGLIRSGLWLCFFGLILWAWWVMYDMATAMDVDLIGRPGEMGARMAAMDPRMDMYMPMAEFGPLFAMWAIMMAAMMGPVMAPTLMTYDQLPKATGATRTGWLGVALGYLLMWVLFAAAITGAQLALLFSGLVDMLGIAKSSWLAAGLLVAVGAFQFTRLKEVCHGVCHTPMTYFLGRWRPGFAGGLRMGAGLGAYCVVCCWGFMALGFVGGVMSLLWMGLATLFMVLEKLPQIGHRLLKPSGVALILGGIYVGLTG